MDKICIGVAAWGIFWLNKNNYETTKNENRKSSQKKILKKDIKNIK